MGEKEAKMLAATKTKRQVDTGSDSSIVNGGGVPASCSQCCQCKKEFPAGILQKCSRCKNALYCSAACQKEAWPTHKLICTSPRPAVVAAAGGTTADAAAVEKKEEEKKEVKKKLTNPQDQASFFDAVIKGTLNKARLKTLLAKNIDIDGEDAKGNTASFYYIVRNDLAMFFFC